MSMIVQDTNVLLPMGGSSITNFLYYFKNIESQIKPRHIKNIRINIANVESFPHSPVYQRLSELVEEIKNDYDLDIAHNENDTRQYFERVLNRLFPLKPSEHPLANHSRRFSEELREMNIFSDDINGTFRYLILANIDHRNQATNDVLILAAANFGGITNYDGKSLAEIMK